MECNLYLFALRTIKLSNSGYAHPSFACILCFLILTDWLVLFFFEFLVLFHLKLLLLDCRLGILFFSFLYYLETRFFRTALKYLFRTAFYFRNLIYLRYLSNSFLFLHLFIYLQKIFKTLLLFDFDLFFAF